MDHPQCPPEIADLPVDVQVLATLFSTLAQTVFRYFNTEPSSLTPLNFLIVITVNTQPGISMSSLATQLGIANSQLSRSVTRLEADHLIRREHNTENRRIVNVYPDQAGSEFAKQNVSAVAEQLNATLGLLTLSERQHLNNLMRETLGILAKTGIVPMLGEDQKRTLKNR